MQVVKCKGYFWENDLLVHSASFHTWTRSFDVVSLRNLLVLVYLYLFQKGNPIC